MADGSAVHVSVSLLLQSSIFTMIFWPGPTSHSQQIAVVHTKFHSSVIAKHNAFPDAQVKPTRIGVCACTCVCVRPVDARIHQPIESQHPTALGVTAPAQLPSAMLHFRHSLCTSSPPSSTNSAVTNSCSLQPLSPPTFPSPTWPSSPLIL